MDVTFRRYPINFQMTDSIVGAPCSDLFYATCNKWGVCGILPVRRDEKSSRDPTKQHEPAEVRGAFLQIPGGSLSDGLQCDRQQAGCVGYSAGYLSAVGRPGKCAGFHLQS